MFADGHNGSPISTEHNRSPEQLWIRGMLFNASQRVEDEFRAQVSKTVDKQLINYEYLRYIQHKTLTNTSQ